jgi:ABC-type dipeptide/oligopeptide/nickel transport system permease component
MNLFDWIVKLTEEYWELFLNGTKNTLIMSLTGTIIGFLIGLVIAIIRTIPTTIAVSLSGYYLLESAFNIPGLGLTLIDSINLQDIYVMQGLILFSSFVSIFSYLIGDLITISLDKRVYLRMEDRENE